MKSKEAKGRPHGVGGLEDLEDHIFVLLVYYRVYMTQAFIGVMYGVDDATICRTIRRAEKLVVKAMHIKKERTVSQADLETLIVDCTEQPIERPKKRAKTVLLRKEKPFHRDVRVYGDSAYEGLHNVHQATETPYKKPKNDELNQEQKEYNTGVSRYRIAVEHTIGQIKNSRFLQNVIGAEENVTI